MLRRAIYAAAMLVGLLVPALSQAPPAVPALPDTQRLTAYSISASLCDCAVGFALYGDGIDVDNWIQVYLNGTRYLSTDPSHGWFLSSVTGPIGAIPLPITDAFLNFSQPQTGTVQIVGARRPRRLSQFPENRGITARDFNEALTDIVAQNRENWDKVNGLAAGGALLTVGTTPITGGINSYCLSDNAGLLGVINCSFGLTVGSTTVTGAGTNGILFNNAGVLGSTSLGGGGTQCLQVTNAGSLGISGFGPCGALSPPTISGLAITRAQISSTNTGALQSLTLVGYTAANDAGWGAPYTCIGQSSTSPLAILSNDGHWCALDAVKSTAPINIGWFGADPTGSADSTAAIQSAIDYTFTNKPKRAVFCPDGNYKVSLPIFLDPPGNLRGADGINGNAYNAGQGYNTNETTNYLGVPYVSLQNSNINNTPNVSPTFWQPLNWNSGTTYATGALVRFNGQIWKSTQNSNLNNTPTLGAGAIGPPGLPWQVWVANAMTSQYSTTFSGSPGLDNASNAQGCSLNFTYNNGMGVVIGAIDGNLLSNVTLFGGNYSYRGLNALNGIGVAISSDGGGASNTKVENVGIHGFALGSETGFNGDGQGERNTWDKINVSECLVGIAIGASQNFVNNAYEVSANCSNSFINTAGPSIHIWGGGSNAPIPTVQNIFTIAVSSISAHTINNIWTYTVTATLSGGCNGGCSSSNNGTITTDPNIAHCNVNNPNAIGNCVYNKWVVQLPGWGNIPMTMTAYNFSSHVATFTIDPVFTFQIGNPNQLDGCPNSGGIYTVPPNTGCSMDFAQEFISSSLVYAVEQATIFTGAGISAIGTHIEPSNHGCIELLSNQGANTTNAGVFLSNIQLQYNIAGTDFRNQNPITDPTYGIFACQQSIPFMDANNGLGWDVIESSFEQQDDPVIIIAPTSAPPSHCIFGNQGNPITNKVQVSYNGNQCEYKQPWVSTNLTNTEEETYIAENGSLGVIPTPWTFPRLRQSMFNALRTMNSSTTLTTIPYIYGNTIYQILDFDNVNQNTGSPAPTGPIAQLVQSSHYFASYGRDLTSSDISGLSWSYKGGTNAVLMDANSLLAMFPGLVIGLDNGGGNKYYYVNAVFPHVSLDSGTHPGYIQVYGPVPVNLKTEHNGLIINSPPSSGVLAGTGGNTPTTYTCPGSCPSTKIAQQPFNWNYISLVQNAGTPTVGTCGTSPSIIGSNTSGVFTTGTATPTACTVTFSPAFPNSATCVITPANAAAATASPNLNAQSASSFTISQSATSSAKYNYICQGS
jgi:hypothetical protein